MKHTLTRTLKKITATAMAFVLLGVGTTVTRSVAPKADNTLTACATSCDNCHGGSYHVTSKYDIYPMYVNGFTYYVCVETVYCGLCGKELATHVYY